MLAKNPLLEEIVNRLKTMPFPMGEAVDYFLVKDSTRNNYREILTASGRIAEIGVKLNMKTISADYGDKIILDPIPSDAKTADYRFRWQNETLVVSSYNHDYSVWCNITDYDLLMLVDNLPVVFEVKTHKSGKRQASLRRYQDGRSGSRISYFIGEDNIRRVTSPLKEYFKTESCGYALITYPEKIFVNHKEHQERFNQFLKAGGFLIPFAYGRNKYLQALIKAIVGKAVF